MIRASLALVLAASAARPAAAAGVTKATQAFKIGRSWRPFVSTVYSPGFLNKISESGGPKLLARMGASLPETRRAALERSLSRRFKSRGLDVALHAPLRYFDGGKKIEQPAALMTFARDGEPVGYAGYGLQRADDGVLEAEWHGVYFDQSRVGAGVAPMLLDYSARELAPAFGVARERLRADTAGRYVWAKNGFAFDPDEPFVDVNNERIPQVQVFRRSLARFMRSRGVDPSHMRLRGRPVDLEELVTPLDFAELELSGGRRISLRPYFNDHMLGPEAELPLGKAYMLSDYRLANPHVRPRVTSKGGAMGNKFAPDAMPYWFGYRDLPAGSIK